MGIRTNGKNCWKSLATFSRTNGNSNKWEDFLSVLYRKNKMGSFAVNILGKANNFLVAKPPHAKTSTESELHISAFHANFRLKSYTVPSDVVLIQLDSVRTVLWSINARDLSIWQNGLDWEIKTIERWGFNVKISDSGYCLQTIGPAHLLLPGRDAIISRTEEVHHRASSSSKAKTCDSNRLIGCEELCRVNLLGPWYDGIPPGAVPDTQSLLFVNNIQNRMSFLKAQKHSLGFFSALSVSSNR